MTNRLRVALPGGKMAIQHAAAVRLRDNAQLAAFKSIAYDPTTATKIIQAARSTNSSVDGP